MPRRTHLIIDVATAPLPEAGLFLDPVKAPSHYKDPAKIDAYIIETAQKRLDEAGLDLDLCRITGVGLADEQFSDRDPIVMLCRDEDQERTALRILADQIGPFTTLVSYNGLHFDWPLLQRRARYLGVGFPAIDTDRYRSEHVDLLAMLSGRDKDRMRSLGFYVRRLGWTDLVKPLDGADEARVFETNKWPELEASLRHDVEAVRRLAIWLGVIPAETRATVGAA